MRFSAKFFDRRRLPLVFLTLAALLLALWLVKADKPWTHGVAAREAAGQNLRVGDYAVTGLWTAGALNLALLLAIIASHGLWLDTGRTPCPQSSSTRGSPGSRSGSNPPGAVWIGCVVAAILLGGSLQWQRMDHSLWNDEEYSLHRYVWGAWERIDKTGAREGLHFDAVEWKETFFFNRGANNHILFSVLARLSIGMWKMTSTSSETHPPEWVYRMPSFLAGLGTIALVALLGRALSMPWGGVVGAFLIAMHPWHVRYASEARGYSLMMMFMVACLICLVSAVRSGRLRWWLGYGLSQAAFMLCFPGALYAALAFALVGFLLVLLGPSEYQFPRWRNLMRFFLGGTVSVMLFLQIYAPSLPQVRLYLAEHDVARGRMGADWLLDIVSHLLAATQWRMAGSPGSHLGVGLAELGPSGALSFWLLIVAVPLLFLAGLVATGIRSRPAFFVLAAPWLAGCLAFGHNRMSGNFLFSWYLIYLLPFMCLASGCGTTFLAVFFRRANPTPCISKTLGVGVPLVLLALLWTSSDWARHQIIEIPRQPMREATALAAEIGRRFPSGCQTAAAGTSAGQISTYDPAALRIESESDLAEAMALTARTKRPLLLYVAGWELIAPKKPDLFAKISDPNSFQEVGHLRGLEEMFSYHLLLHTPPQLPAGDPD